MITKTFALGDILTVITGRLVTPRGVGAAYDVLGWMTGRRVQPYQVPGASRECAFALYVQHPDLGGGLPPPDFGDYEAVACWLAAPGPRRGRPARPAGPAGPRRAGCPAARRHLRARPAAR